LKKLGVWILVTIALISVMSLPMAYAQTRAGAIALNPGEDSVQSAVIDPPSSFAYFGTQASDRFQAAIVKVDLRNFGRVGALAPDPAIGALTASAIDIRNGFAYFGGPAKSAPLAYSIIVKIKLSDFTVAGKVIVNESYPVSAVIDTNAGFAYFGGWSRSTTGRSGIVRLRLSDFTVAGILTLNLSEEQLTSAVIDTENGFAYFGTCSSPSEVVKIRLSEFGRVDSLVVGSDESCLGSGVIDPAGGYAYFATYLGGSSTYYVPGKVVKVRLSDFTRVGATSLPKGDLGTAVIDPQAGLAYFGSGSNYPGTIFAIQLSNLAVIGSLVLNNGESLEHAHGSAVIDAKNGFAYFATSSPLGGPAIIVKIQVLKAGETTPIREVPGILMRVVAIGLISGLIMVVVLRKRRESFHNKNRLACITDCNL